MHPLRGVHEHLPGLSAQRWPELWRDLFRADWRHHRPDFDIRKYSNLPFASTLNGSCTSVCPVKINIHEQIYKWRRVIAERNQLPFVKKATMKAAGKVFGNPKLFRATLSATETAIEDLPRFVIYNWFNPWGRQRELPQPPAKTFREWYIENRGGR